MLYTFTLWPAHGQGAAFVLLRGPRAHPGTQVGVPHTSLWTLGQEHTHSGQTGCSWASMALEVPGTRSVGAKGRVPCIEVLSSLGATDAQIGTPRPFESSAHSFWSQTPAQTKGLFGKESNVDPLPSVWGGEGAEAQGVLGSVAARLLQEGHRSVNQLPQGPSLAPPATCCSTGP